MNLTIDGHAVNALAEKLRTVLDDHLEASGVSPRHDGSGTDEQRVELFVILGALAANIGQITVCLTMAGIVAADLAPFIAAHTQQGARALHLEAARRAVAKADMQNGTDSGPDGTVH